MENIKFKALEVNEIDGEFKREIIEKEINDLPEGDLIINVKYSSLNYKDALSAAGNKGVTREYPHTPGIDAAGIVVEDKSGTYKKGDKVIVTGYDFGMNTDGGFEEYIRIPAGWAVKLPQNLSLRQSMIYGTAGFTAALSVYKLLEADVDKNNILVTGASGGVGSFACAILAKIGYKVTAATGKSGARYYFNNLGVENVIDRKEVDDDSGRMLLKEKWDGVIDTVGGNILTTAIKATKYDGAVTCCGNVASAKLDLNVYPFILRGISLFGIDSVQCKRELREEAWKKIASDWKVDQLDEFSTEVLLEDLNDQIENMLAGNSKGRVIVKL
ncbi:Alcohol dehydrogenase [Halanaerobium saccharolyticum subsp. saccharolyticum DSM 6643]|uniref:Alcohol dehydrogenase n=1 Tax=Halanaerobium saccharolyticum subsp. saccharolyticum DSM 6643 TaxID=1293054 RepID=M5DYF3_9FIRM|nr:YhdH/YhfP family quinone oxidoreductase [Halanaerobium saccharolyticum]CCU78129.1 Alcohol dehydrogenase [Halanaerobium saccharolyticum subsp. saccharolyticum DSM 6643]